MPRAKNKTKHKKTSKDKEEDNQIRVPRTAGLTELCKNLNLEQNTTKKKKLLDSIQRNILNRYITDGFRLNGQTIDLQQLSTYLRVPMTQIVRLVTRYQTGMAGLTEGGEEGLQETYRAVMAMALNNSLVDRGHALTQLETLKASQGAQYVPFVSGAVNVSIQTLLQSNRSFIDLMKAMNPGNGLTINNNNQQANMAGDGQKAIGPNEATRLIDQARAGETLLTQPDMQIDLYSKHIEGKELPEINATLQKNFNMKEYGATAIPLKVELPVAKETHGDRRGEVEE